jgi:cation:H+ antiporter
VDGRDPPLEDNGLARPQARPRRVVLLAAAGRPPELAITISAASSGNLGLAAGNLIGGIATQTMVLVLCDLAAPQPLTYVVDSLNLAIVVYAIGIA